MCVNVCFLGMLKFLKRPIIKHELKHNTELSITTNIWGQSGALNTCILLVSISNQCLHPETLLVTKGLWFYRYLLILSLYH